MKFTCKKASDIPKGVTLVFKIDGIGKAEYLLCDRAGGIIRLNDWSSVPCDAIRVLHRPSDNNPGVRFVRASCTKELVDKIRSAGGTVYCGTGRATVQYKMQPLVQGVVVPEVDGTEQQKDGGGVGASAGDGGESEDHMVQE